MAKPANQKEAQNTALEKRRARTGLEGTIAHGGCHGRGAPLLPFGCFILLRSCSFSCAVFQFMLCFVFKKEDVSGLKEGRIPMPRYSLSLSNSIEEIGRS